MAAPDKSKTLEGAIGGLPLVRTDGLNTNQPVNFSGWTVTTGGVGSGNATGPTGSFANLNVQTAEITGASASVAILGTAGALAGGPTTSQQDGWMIAYIAGVKVFIPVWK